jgi:hypothetical protein
MERGGGEWEFVSLKVAFVSKSAMLDVIMMLAVSFPCVM